MRKNCSSKKSFFFLSQMKKVKVISCDTCQRKKSQGKMSEMKAFSEKICIQ